MRIGMIGQLRRLAGDCLDTGVVECLAERRHRDEAARAHDSSIVLARMGFMFVLLLPCPELSATPPAKLASAYAIPTERPDIYAHPAAGLPVRSISCSIANCLRDAPPDGSTGGRRSSLRFSNRSSSVSGNSAHGRRAWRWRRRCGLSLRPCQILQHAELSHRQHLRVGNLECRGLAQIYETSHPEDARSAASSTRCSPPIGRSPSLVLTLISQGRMTPACASACNSQVGRFAVALQRHRRIEHTALGPGPDYPPHRKTLLRPNCRRRRTYSPHQRKEPCHRSSAFGSIRNG